MLPKNKLSRGMLSKLKVYVGPKHPHEAQQPQHLELPLGRGKARRNARKHRLNY